MPRPTQPMILMTLSSLAALLALAAGCGKKHENHDEDESGATAYYPPDEGATQGDSVIDSDQQENDTTTQHVACEPPAGINNDPRTIAEAVTLINALPKPVSTACLIEALKKPLKMNATTSRLSVQPAINASSPRIFLFFGDLTVTFVPEGDGAKTVEFSDRRSASTSVKAELAFPVTESISQGAQYKRILRKDGRKGTTCSGCHDNEGAAGGTFPPDAFVSRAFRPRPASDVSVLSLEQQALQCGDEVSFRCDVLRALFQTEVEPATFPEDMPLMF